MLHDIDRRRRPKFMDDRMTIMDKETRLLRFWRAVIWTSIFVACAIFWIAAGAAAIRWIF